MYTYLGQSESDDAAQAAGDAAFDRAQESAWPPTEDDYEAIGAVAGAAAGSIIGGPVGAAIGSVVGTAVGSFIYGIGDAIAGGLDPNRGAGDAPMLQRFITRVVAPSPKQTAEALAKQCGTSVDAELAALQHRGVALRQDNATPSDLPKWFAALRSGGAPAARPLVEAFQRKLFAATAARVAECETKKKVAAESPPKSSSSAAPVLVGAAIAAGVAWWLLA